MRHRKRNPIIREILISRGITQCQAAFDMNRPRCRVSLESNGYVVPGPDIRRQWSDYLGLPQRVLFPSAESFTQAEPGRHVDRAPKPCRSTLTEG